MVKSMKKILYSSLAWICLFFFSTSAVAQNDERSSVKGRDCSISLYPNPTTSRLFIDLGQPTITEPTVMIFDMLGNKMDGLYPERKDPQTWLVDFNGIKPGFYFVKIRTSEESISRRITINP